MLKKDEDIRLLFQRSQRSYGKRMIVEIVGIARVNQFFSDSGDPSNYIWKPGLKNSGENDSGLAHSNALTTILYFFDPIMKNTIRNTILENKLRYGHPKKPSGLV